MLIIYGTVVILIVSISLTVLGLALKIKKLKIAGIILFTILVIFWIAFTLWAIADESEEYQRRVVDVEEKSNVIEESTAEDITDKFLNDEITSRDGKISKIENDNIYFFDKENNNYCLRDEESTNYINGRTGENISFSDIEEGDYIDVSWDLKCYIFKNISGEELKNEILRSLSLADDFDISRTGVTEIKNVEQLGNNEAIVTFTIVDLVTAEYYPDVNDEEHTFEVKLKVNDNTEYNTNFHGILMHDASSIFATSFYMLYIRINPNTLSNEYPEISEFDAYSN